jgi:hypothetical protein
MSEVKLDPLPGFMPRKDWAKANDLCDRTAKRLQDRGRIVVQYLGKFPFVDVPGTAARMRGGDQPKRRRGA